MKKIINWGAYITLTIAFIIGYISSNNSETLSNLRLVVDNGLMLDDAGDGIYKVSKDSNLFGYLSVAESQGYGGPLKTAVLSDVQGNILGTELIRDFETHAFLMKLKSNKYFDQYFDMQVNGRFELGNDLNAVSGATVSSRAIANAVREASHRIALEKLDMTVPVYKKEWRVSKEELIILLLFFLGTIAILFKKKKLRYLTQFLGFVFIGFMFNASLTLTHFGRVILGYFPDIHTHLTWWILMSGTLSVIFIWGKNVYCSSMCPFRATQVLLNKISGINLKMPHKLSRIMSKTPMFLLWLSLMLIFISANPTLSSYEPFAMLFSLKGHGVQWYILPTSLIGALFFSNFFCRFFCPVGGVLGWTLKVRSIVTRKNVKAKKPKVFKPKKQEITKGAIFGMVLYAICLISIVLFIINEIK